MPTMTHDLSRRMFVSGAVTAGVAAAIVREPFAASARAEAESAAPAVAGAVAVTLKVNGQTQALRLDPRTTLLDCLREHLLLTGTKKGCDHGQCGACTVHVNGRRVNACLSLAPTHEGDEITTLE